MISFVLISIILVLIIESESFVHTKCFHQAKLRPPYSTNKFQSLAFVKRLRVSVDDSQVDSANNDDKHAIPKSVQQINKFTVETIKKILSLYYGERHFARFAALETIARVPYFSYTSVLHLYETLGWFRKKEYNKMHFAESWNELHHLLIMESLGGTDEFGDRFIAQHIAFFYYWIVVTLYILSPAIAYNLNMYVERHAFDTYDKFLKSHGEELKRQPAPQVAIEYYQNGHNQNKDKITANIPTHKIDTSFMKDSIFAQVSAASFPSGSSQAADGGSMSSTDTTLVNEKTVRRPIINNLYDVFYNICLDEAEHAQTMEALSYDIEDIKSASDSR